MLLASTLETGARRLKLSRHGRETRVEELWSNPRVQFYHATSVRDGDWVYGASGSRAAVFMTAVNARTGQIGWRERGIGMANVIAADGKLVVLGEDGTLYLATATPEKLTVLARTRLLDGVAWTVPTLAGSVPYVRDRERIVAVDLR